MSEAGEPAGMLFRPRSVFLTGAWAVGCGLCGVYSPPFSSPSVLWIFYFSFLGRRICWNLQCTGKKSWSKMEDPWQSLCDLESKCQKLEPHKSWEAMWVKNIGKKKKTCDPVSELCFSGSFILGPFDDIVVSTVPHSKAWARHSLPFSVFRVLLHCFRWLSYLGWVSPRSPSFSVWISSLMTCCHSASGPAVTAWALPPQMTGPLKLLNETQRRPHLTPIFNS